MSVVAMGSERAAVVGRRRLSPWAIAFAWVLSMAVPALVHLRYGLRDTPLLEEWSIQYAFATSGPVFWTPSDPGGLSVQAIRPLTVALQSLAFVLDPDSFRFYHLFHAAALALKGLAMMALLRRLRFNPAIALTGALLFALFPAWEGLFALRTMQIQIAVGLFVLACERLLAFYERPTTARALAAATLLLTSLLFYEVAYVAALLAPALLATKPWRGPRPLLITLACWFTAPLLNGLRIISIYLAPTPQYQQVAPTTDSRLTSVAKAGSRLWDDGFSSLLNPPYAFGLSLLTIVCLAASVVAIRLGARPTPHAPGRRHLTLLTLGAIVAGPIVIAIYAPNPGYLTDPLRIFSIGSVPLTLALVTALALATRLCRPWQQTATILTCALLTTSVITSATAQRTHWHDLSTAQGNTLGALTTALGPLPTNATVVVLDPEHLTGDLYTILPEYFGGIFAYLNERPEYWLVCHQSAEAIAHDTDPATLAPGTCTINGTTLFTAPTPRYMSDPASGSSDISTIKAVEIRRSTGAKHDPSSEDSPSSIVGKRVSNVVTCLEAHTCADGPLGVQARLVALAPGRDS